jgi:hypothetical protein
MFDRRILIAAAFTAALFTAGGAFAQGQAIVGIQTVTTYSSEGRISSVDPNARAVTIIFPDGATRTHNVSPAVANFGSTRIGDTVSVGFEDKLTFVLSGPGTKTPRDRDTTLTAATSAGQSVAGVGASQAIGTWWVVAVNPTANTITLVNPNSGPVRTSDVTTPAGREQLPRVKPGDSLTAINSQVLVLSITPKA